MVRKIGDVLNHSFEAGGNAIHIAASIGQSVFPQDGRSLEELLWKADGAMYLHKKRTHKNNGMVSIWIVCRQGQDRRRRSRSRFAPVSSPKIG